MLNIVALACLAALFPLMLAAVVLTLTRPRPKRMLISFLAGGWAMSVATGLLVLEPSRALITRSWAPARPSTPGRISSAASSASRRRFTFAEVPLVSYLFSPEKTAERVARFQDLLTRNGRGS